jgi:iron complex outermembrane receptor protein
MRYESYSDFGGNLAGKLAARYTLTRKISARASVSNGFRAPSLQQRYYSQTRLAPNAGTWITSGTFRNNSDVAKALGIPSLAAERSMNLSGGFTGSLYPNIRFTADAYWIQIKNRIVLSGIFNRNTNSNVKELLKDITDVTQVQFFTNAINTRTKGLDIILNGNWKIRNATLKAMLAANFTQTRLFGEIKRAGNLKADSLNTNTLFGTEEKTRLEKGQPSDKILLSFNYQIGRIQVHLQNTRFGKTVFAPTFTDPRTGVTSFLFQSLSPKILTDISLTYSLNEWMSLTLGANNIFDVYPDRMKDYRNTGEGMYIYTQETTAFGFYGGYYFLSMSFSF